MDARGVSFRSARLVARGWLWKSAALLSSEKRQLWKEMMGISEKGAVIA